MAYKCKEEFDVNKEKYMTDEQAAFAMYILLQILHADGSYTVENSEYFKKVSKALSEASEGSEIVPDSMMIEFLNSEYTKASEENHKLNLDDVRKKTSVHSILLNTFNSHLPQHFKDRVSPVFDRDVAMTLYKHCLMTAVSDSNRSYETAEFLDDLRKTLKLKLEDCLVVSQSYGIL